MKTVCLSSLPDLLQWHQLDPQAYPVLLESSGDDGWHVLMAFPDWMRQFSVADLPEFDNALRQLDFACVADIDVPDDLPFRGGWFLYLGYEYLHHIEPSVPLGRSANDFPLAALFQIPAVVLQHRGRGETWLLATDDAQMHRLQQDSQQVSSVNSQSYDVQLEEEPEQRFLDGVSSIREYIRAGDVFQVNLSRRWQGWAKARLNPATLRLALRTANPAPFSGLVRFDSSHALVSSSPERLFSVKNGHIATRPIAGTHPRLIDPDADIAQRESLLNHPKERAEHIMLVDLERNDLGRICQAGTVSVDELMAVHSYAWVHHIESVVSGKLRRGTHPADIIRALFPGGTITGCPKVRTMQIIGELEHSPRYAYTGSMGYINRNGDMDLNILIRTMMVNDHRLAFSAGAGIVADSDPQRELAETRAKARGMLRALGIAG